MIISLQGSMAVGKTSVLKAITKRLPGVTISYEDVTEVITKIKQHHLDKDNDDDYQIIQGLWIDHEIARYEKIADEKLVLMDFGAEEIDFYTRAYPKASGKDWQLSQQLINKLNDLEPCLPDLVIFLDASSEELRRRKALDKTRSRSFFDFQLENLLPIKRDWFLLKANTVLVDTNGKSVEQVGDEGLRIISSYVSDN
ncbi:deoxynucleoside kinase [Streptococcus halotolerans]|uniref:deoxynucleoside kinase n=1 Tax=Streptococcus halotolerans TaxID=1814128 RepID=UPI000789A7A0|nr:deoxynucleoside kinase [Streptococcus halotolerans]